MAISSFTGEFAFLSNFYGGPLGQASAEHIYQALKTDDELWRIKILSAATPGRAKRLGRKCPMRANHEENKINMMTTILIEKFRDPVLRARLLATGDEELVEENNWGDTFWGVCDGKGENHLGKILMAVREFWRIYAD